MFFLHDTGCQSQNGLIRRSARFSAQRQVNRRSSPTSSSFASPPHQRTSRACFTRTSPLEIGSSMRYIRTYCTLIDRVGHVPPRRSFPGVGNELVPTRPCVTPHLPDPLTPPALEPSGLFPLESRHSEPSLARPRVRDLLGNGDLGGFGWGLAYVLSIAHKWCRPSPVPPCRKAKRFTSEPKKMLRISGNRLLVLDGCIRHTPTPGANDHISSRTKDLGTPLRATVKGGGAIIDGSHGHTPGFHRAR
jgi:hypothetical protein